MSYKHFFTGFAIGVLSTVASSSLFPSSPANAAAGTATFTGTSQELTGDITAARLLDQANTAYLIDPAASGNSLITAGAASVSGNLVLNAAATIQTTNMNGLTIGSATTGNTTITSGNKLQLQAGGTGTGSIGTGSIYFLDSSGTVKGRFAAQAGDATIHTNFGTGADGAVTITASKDLNTNTIAGGRAYADGIAYRVNAPADGATSVTSYSTANHLPNGLAPNDEVLLINLQGASGDLTDVGSYEFMRIKNITTSTITFTTAITKSFDGTTASNQKVVVQRVPNYTDVTLSGSGSLTASSWDGLSTTPSGTAGYYTGTVVFRASGTVTINSGTSITTAGKGYRGGSGVAPGRGYQGESTNPTQSRDGAANQGAGGGGRGYDDGSCGAGGGGGGAGYSASGGNGGNNGTCTGGTGGSSYGAAALTSLFHGSGGGSGGGDNTNSSGAGGRGGGIVFIAGNSITVSGTVSANGNAGSNSNVGAGGGGSGGSVFIASGSPTLGTSLVSASGGGAGTGNVSGGAGAAGRIRVEYTGTLSGSTSPAASTQTSISSNAQSPSGSGVYGTFFMGSTNTGSADLAEYYVSGDKSIAAGDVVTISNTKILDGSGQEITNKGVLRKATRPYDRNLIGVISTQPGVLMGSVDGTDQSDQRMLALAGRAPIKIDPASPPIEVGDFLTSSTKPGLATKATRPGYVVARALESWSPGGPGTIEAFIQLSYYMGDIDPFGNFRTLEVDTLKVNKALEVGEVNVMDEINELKRRLDGLEKRVP